MGVAKDRLGMLFSGILRRFAGITRRLGQPTTATNNNLTQVAEMR
jgi:hypothetical protein